MMSQALFEQALPMADAHTLGSLTHSKASHPLYFFHHAQGIETYAFNQRWVIEPNTHLVVIQDYIGTDSPYCVNAAIEIMIAEGASLTYYGMQREGRSATHHSTIEVTLAAGSSFEAHMLSVGAAWADTQLQVNMTGSNASCVLNGVYLANQQRITQHKVAVNHYAPASTSHQVYKGILRDQAKACFNGTVFVEKGAIQTVAHQSNKNLLLSKQAEVKTQPILNILVDDVLCSHGATVGQLDDEALFYLASRGLPEQLAHQYLIEAFIDDHLGRLTLAPIKQWITTELTSFLRG